MKSILLSTALIALLGLSGCSTKEPSIDTTDASSLSGADGQTENITDDIMAVDADGFTGADGEMTMSGIESKMQSVTFDFDKFDIRADMKDQVVENSDLANAAASAYTVKLEGNCDEWGSDEYNYALGLKRANSVKNEMIQNGVDASRITMVSYGESNPVCSDKSESCWSQNRRVDFKLLP